MSAIGVIGRVIARYLTHPVVRAAAVEALRAGFQEILRHVSTGRKGGRRSSSL